MTIKRSKSATRNLREYKRILKRIVPFIRSFSEDDVSDREHFRLSLKAAFIKSYELCVAATQGDPLKDFFVMSGLRGVCEEYIVFRFLFKHHPSNKGEIIRLKVQEEVFQSSLVQWDFFREHHPRQVLYYQDDFELKLDAVRTGLKALMGIHLKGRTTTMPSVSYMAKKSDLSVLYNYLYHASSSLVHFNPRMLLRMGWGNLPQVSFSVSNFTAYYRHFGLFYSIYLFKELIVFLNQNGLALEIQSEASSLDDLLEQEKHWPELVTFEEVNVGAMERFACFDSPNSYARQEA